MQLKLNLGHFIILLQQKILNYFNKILANKWNQFIENTLYLYMQVWYLENIFSIQESLFLKIEYID